MNLDLRALIGKLNHETKGAVEAAAGLCLSRTHYDVEIEHYLMKLLDSDRRRLRRDPEALRRGPLATGRRS